MTSGPAGGAGTGPAGGSGTGPGREIAPLTADQRADNYRRQNGTDRLTPKQRRRLEKKAARAGEPR